MIFNQKQAWYWGKFLALAWICGPAFCFSQSNLPLGAIINKTGSNVTGVTFRVWAPNATNVVVKGGFNGWGDTPMTKDSSTGYWSANVTTARPGQEYKYFLKWPGNTNGSWRVDPRAVWVRNGNSVIYDPTAFDWGSVSRPIIPVGKQVMYEMHIGTFYDSNPADGRPGTFDDAILRLDYLQRLGINVLALMPVNEFGGDFSWGYNPEHVYAIESAYGGPDGLKRFVKAAHQRGMKVQIDVVHNHYNPGGEGLWDFDGSSNIYFFPDNRITTPWGSRPNYDLTEVRNFIQDNIRLMLDQFQVDGFRWDSPQNILGYHSAGTSANPDTVLPGGKSLLMGVNRMIHEQYPGCWSIAEDAGLLAVNETFSGFPGADFYQALVVTDSLDSFDGHWQTSFHNIITPEIATNNPTVGLIQSKVSGWSEPPGYRVIFTDNHDKAGDLNQSQRLPNRMVPLDPLGKLSRKKILLNAALTMTAPGTPMILMGQEFLATGAFSSGSSANNARLNWVAGSSQHRIMRAHRDLIQLRETLPALQKSDLSTAAGFINEAQDLMAYWRLGGVSAEHLVVLYNFSNQDTPVQLPFPTTGTWYVRFNSDWKVYGPDFGDIGPSTDSVNATLQGSTVLAGLTIAAQSVVIFATTPAPADMRQEDGNGNNLPEGWEIFCGPSGAYADNDQDGFSNLNEYLLGLDPNEANPTLVKGTLPGWGATSSIMRVNASPNTLAYLQLTETASSGQEAKFLSPEGWFGTSTNPGTASVGAPGSNIPHVTLSKGYAYFTFNTSNKAYAISNFTPTSGVVDQDNNGMDDRWESWFGVSDPNADPDQDGFTNLQEFNRGSDPKVWNRPQLALAGVFNNWNASTNPLVYFWHNQWYADLPFRNGSSGLFKFTDGTWVNSWGDNPAPDGVVDSGGSNISINFNQGSGVYRFQFNEASSAYQVTYDATDANADGLQDAWAGFYGLSGTDATASADPDGDGITNLAELRRWSSPIVVDRMSVVGNRTPLAWSPDDAPLRMTWSDVRQRWEWAGDFAAGSLAFKFASGPGWNGANYGTGTNVAINTASTAGTSDISTSLLAGRYRFAFSETSGGYIVESLPVSSEWREVNGLPPAGAWTNDTDKDGVNDLLEYALGGNPTNHSDGRALQTMTTTNVGGTNRLVLQWFQRTDGGSSLEINPETATDLTGTWSPAISSNASSQVGVPANHQRKEASVPQDGSKKFLRLKVTGP